MVTLMDAVKIGVCGQPTLMEGIKSSNRLNLLVPARLAIYKFAADMVPRRPELEGFLFAAKRPPLAALHGADRRNRRKRHFDLGRRALAPATASASR